MLFRLENRSTLNAMSHRELDVPVEALADGGDLNLIFLNTASSFSLALITPGASDGWRM